MKYWMMFICVLIVAGCEDPTVENMCKDGDNAPWKNIAKCYKDYSQKLEHDIEILKIRMEYECNDGIQNEK